MSEAPLRVALIGGVPPSIGGGGLEIQVERSAAALGRRGHEAFLAAREPGRREFDVLHAFGTGPDVLHYLEHWRRCTAAPLVYSPVMVVAPGTPELRQRVAHRLPLPEFPPAARRAAMRRSAALIALTAHEAALLGRLAGPGAPPIVVIPNGVDPAPEPSAPPPGLPEGYVTLVGTVNPRKRQLDVVRALAGGPPPVVAGGFEGTAAERAAFEQAVAAAGGRWLGEVDAGTVRAVVRGSVALVHLSQAEGQSLAVLEALAEGTPVVGSPLPANRELAAAHPAHVRLIDAPDQLTAALAGLGPRPPLAPVIPTWDDVAARLDQVYRQAGAGR